MSKTILAIIVPCFNGERYLERCLSSLNTLPDEMVEIIIVNDGSTDSSKMIIEKWIQNRENAQLFNKINGGYCSAINYGLDNCKSEYVMFMGVDDELSGSGIVKICDLLVKNKPDYLAFSTVKVFDDKEGLREKEKLTHYDRQGLFNGDLLEIYGSNREDSKILFNRDTSRCFKRSTIGNLRYFGRIGVSADGCFSCLVAYKSKSFEFENIECYLWHLHEDSVSSRPKTIERTLDEAEVWMGFFGELLRLHHSKVLPGPIMGYFYKYKEDIDALKSIGDMKMAGKHNAFANDISKWMIRGRFISLGSYLRIRFPKLYKVYSRFTANQALKRI